MRRVWRLEKKYVINMVEFLQKTHELQQLLHEDPHNGVHGYIIRSLYFDTEYDDDYFEKEQGLYVRKKVRLRIYDHEAESAALEMKKKQGEQQLKRSLRVSREDAQRLISCDYTPLLRYPEDFAAECYALMNSRCYRPRVVIQYRRKAFIAKENNIRITFDREIDATESNFDLFDPDLIMNPVMDRSQIVMAVSYTHLDVYKRQR